MSAVVCCGVHAWTMSFHSSQPFWRSIWLLHAIAVDEIGTVDEQQEAVELLTAVGAEADVAVERRLDRRRLDRPRAAR